VLGQEPETVDFYRDFTAVGPLYFINKASEAKAYFRFCTPPPTALPLPIITIPLSPPLFHRPGIDIAHLIAR